MLRKINVNTIENTETDVWNNKISSRFTFSIACHLFMSMEDPERVMKLEEPFNTVAIGVFSIPINFPGTRFNRAIKASRLLRKEVSAIMRRRKEEVKVGKASAEQDILSHMLMSIGETEDDDVADKIIGLLIGGHDTASIVCTFIVSYLADFPHVYKRVLQGTRLSLHLVLFLIIH